MPAPSLETPPNPVDTSAAPAKVRTGRFGELEEHELIHLLDTLDDERARGRFRESIYISLFVYTIIGWFLFYGPRVLFHQPQIVMRPKSPNEVTRLETPFDIARRIENAPRPPRATPPPAARQVNPKTLEAMRKAAAAAKPTPAVAAPQPAAATPPPPPIQQPQPSPLPTIQRPPTPAAAIPDAPRPAPNFSQNHAPGDTLRDALRDAAKGGRGGGADSSAGIPVSRNAGAGAQMLSDPMGVDFGPYIEKILRDLKRNWIPLLPVETEPPLNKRGTTQIRFSILPDGTIGGMTLEGSTHDSAIDKAAWGSITSEGQFPPLPSQFHGPNLELRITFLVNQRPE